MPPPPFFWQQFMTAVPITFICAMQLQLFLFLFPINRICLQPFLTTSLTLCFFFYDFALCTHVTLMLKHSHTHTRTHTCSFAYGASLEFFRFKLYKRHTLFDKLVSSFLFFCICSIKPKLFLLTFFFACLFFKVFFFVSQLKDPFLNLYSFFLFLCSLRRLLFFRAQIYIYIFRCRSLLFYSVSQVLPVITLYLSSLGSLFFCNSFKAIYLTKLNRLLSFFPLFHF